MFKFFYKKQDLTKIFEASDNLARQTCSMGMYIAMKQKESFLNNSELTRTDAVIFSAFLNHLLIVSDAKNKYVREQVVNRYLEFVYQIIEEDGGCFEYGIPSCTITKMIENRFSFYSSIFQLKPNIGEAIKALVEEFEYIIKMDVLYGEFRPFSASSPLPILGFDKDVRCRIETKNYPSFTTQMLEKPLTELLQLIK